MGLTHENRMTISLPEVASTRSTFHHEGTIS